MPWLIQHESGQIKFFQILLKPTPGFNVYKYLYRKGKGQNPLFQFKIQVYPAFCVLATRVSEQVTLS